MRHIEPHTLGLLAILGFSVLFSSESALAQGKRQLYFHHATHLSGGWIAFSNGSLYACEHPAPQQRDGPQCKEASGLPADLQKVTALWGEPGIAWVAYSDGRVYACSSPVDRSSRYDQPDCQAARGIP